MLAGVAYNKIYANSEVEATGNISGVAGIVNGDTVTLVTANGTDVVVLAAGPFGDVNAIVADINSQIDYRVVGTTAGVEAVAVDTDTVTITTVNGVDVIVLGNAPYVDMDALVDEINAQIDSRVVGTDLTAFSVAADGNTIDITSAGGTDVIVLANAPYADMDALVTEINSSISNAIEVEAFNSNEFLGFQNPTNEEGETFTLADGASTAVIDLAGIVAGVYLAEVQAINVGDLYLGFENGILNSGIAFTLSDGANDPITEIAGIDAGSFTYEAGAFNDGGSLGFNNGTGNTGVSFSLELGAGPSVLNKIGLTEQDVATEATVVSNSARDDALANFSRGANPEVL